MGLASKLQAAPGAMPGGAMPPTAANQLPPAPAGYPQPNNPASMNTHPPQGYIGQPPMGQSIPYGAPSAPPAPFGAPQLSSNNPFAAPPTASNTPGNMLPQQQQQIFGNPLGTTAPGSSFLQGQAPQQLLNMAPQQPAGAPQQQQQQQMMMMMGARPPGGNGFMQQQPQQSGPGYVGAATPTVAAAGGSCAVASGPPGGLATALFNKLQCIVAVNHLQRFYNPQSLQSLANRLDATVNFRELAARWRMPLELAIDLASLALYDVIMFCDDSGSMAFEENGERIDDLKLIASKVAEVATLFDQDGILLRFMNAPVQGDGIRSAAEVAALLANVQYAGLTPLATALQQKVLQPIVYNLAQQGQLQKPVLIITITDGEPTDTPRDLVVQVIKEAQQRLQQYGPKAVAFQFAQVGKDQRAQAFLNRLDTNPEVGASIDCTSYFELEAAEYQQKGITLSPEMWLVKMMCGSVDPTYDEGDE